MAIYAARVINLGVPSNNPNLPDESEFIQYVPAEDLTGFWRAASGIAVSDAEPVPVWAGKSGVTASQGTESLQPLFVDDDIAPGFPSVKGDGTDDYMTTNVNSSVQGVICAAVKTPASFPGGTAEIVISSHVSTSSTVSIGLQPSSGDHMIAGSVGSVKFGSLKDSVAAIASTGYLVTLAWDGATAYLRVNGVQVATAAYTGGAPTDNPYMFFARPSGIYSACGIGATALYGEFKTGATLSEIEAGVAAAGGIEL